MAKAEGTLIHLNRGRHAYIMIKIVCGLHEFHVFWKNELATRTDE